jgi:hypothetical protein
MRVSNGFELASVSGGEAGDGYCGGWGTSSAVTQVCYTPQVGPATSQTCLNSDGTTSVQTCLQAGPSVTVAGVGVGITFQICTTTTTPTGGYGNGNGSVPSGSTGSSHFG